jgi:SPX domain protein involved in polyphosphate accumulation
MRFGYIFETHKIPEWYDAYLDYKRLKKLVKKFKTGVKAGNLRKLNGLYRVNKKFIAYRADLFDYDEDELDRSRRTKS